MAYGEGKLSEWMVNHAKVAWVESRHYEQIEADAIKTYCPPLNWKHNPQKFHALAFLKQELKKHATGLGSEPPHGKP